MAFFATDVLHSDVPVDFLCTYLLDIQLNFASVTLKLLSLSIVVRI